MNDIWSPEPFDRGGQLPVEVAPQIVGPCCTCSRSRADHHVRVARHRREQGCHPVAQHTLRAVADDSVADGLGHHESDAMCIRRRTRRCHDEPGTRRPSGTTTAQHCGKIRTVAQSVVRRQHCRLTGGQPVAPQAEILLRPLARRADRMERPARVRIRRRKPCTLARRRVLGWKVRLLTVVSVEMCGPTVGPVVRWSWGLRFGPPERGRSLPEGTVVVQADVSEGGSQLRYGPPVDRVKPTDTARFARPNPSSKSSRSGHTSRHAVHCRKFFGSRLAGR